MFLISWVWWQRGGGGSPVGPDKEEAKAEEIIEEFVLLDAAIPKVTKNDVLKLQDNFPFPVHPLSLNASVCCISEAERILKIYQERNCDPARVPPLSIEDEGPYKLAFWSVVKKTEMAVSRNHYFLNSDMLGARGNLDGKEKIMLLTGQEVSCAVQTLRDITRWNEYSHISFSGEAVCLAPDPKANKLVVGVGANRELPIGLVNLLEKIQAALETQNRFENFTRFFNQSPLNDMLYRMMADVYTRWKVALFPCKKMTRSFHLFTESGKEHPPVRKVIITVQGIFDGGAIEDRGVIEPKPGQVLGLFYGTTVINLDSGAGAVKTHVEVFPERWKSFQGEAH